MTLTQHPTESAESDDIISHSSISKNTPKVLKELPQFYTTITTTVDENQIHPELPPNVELDISKFLAEEMSLSVDNEKEWLQSTWENYPNQMINSWSAFYANKQVKSTFPVCKTSLLPLFNESSTDYNIILHTMRIIKNSTDFLNPGQVSVMVCDQKNYAIAKQIQWMDICPVICESNFFLMLGGLHFEKAALQLVANLLEGSEWASLIFQSGIFKKGVAEKIASNVPYIKRARRAHEITLAALYILMKKAFDSRQNPLMSYQDWYDERLEKSSMFFYWVLVMELQANVLGFIRSLRKQNWKM